MFKLFMTRKQKILQKKINKGLDDIAEAELFIDFYEANKDLMTDAKEVAEMNLKTGQLRDSIKTNMKFINYAQRIK